MGSNFTICLDIDETLIHSTEGKVSERQIHLLDEYWAYKRPHLDKFLKEISGFAELGIYTAAGEVYANRFISLCASEFDFKFVLTSRSTVARWGGFSIGDGYNYIKDLNKCVRSRSELDRFVAVDDLPKLYPRQYGNIIGVPSYQGSASDDVLPKLGEYLKWLSRQENVRKIEKRNWINRFDFGYAK